jgi:preprotein translocase subunit SecD
VTLLIGIITTLFTAVFASRLMIDLYIEKFKVKEMSI